MITLLSSLTVLWADGLSQMVPTRVGEAAGHWWPTWSYHRISVGAWAGKTGVTGVLAHLSLCGPPSAAARRQPDFLHPKRRGSQVSCRNLA